MCSLKYIAIIIAFSWEVVKCLTDLPNLFFQHWSLNLSASSVKMKMAPLFTTASQMDTGMATTGMGMVTTEIMGTERRLMDTMAMAIMVMFLETMDIGTTGMVTISKRRLKIRDAPTAEAAETLSRCPSVLILFLFRSLMKTCRIYVYWWYRLLHKTDIFLHCRF